MSAYVALSVKVIVDSYKHLFLLMGVARDLHRRCIYYPSPTRSVCEDTLVDVCVSYPEHVYTWEGYGNHSVSSCVCLSVCLCVSS